MRLPLALLALAAAAVAWIVVLLLARVAIGG